MALSARAQVRAHLRSAVESMRRSKALIVRDPDNAEIYKRELEMQKFHFRMTWLCLRHVGGI